MKTIVNKSWIRREAAEIHYMIKDYMYGDLRDHAWREACSRGRGNAHLEWAIYKMWLRQHTL